jgi:hypothetical protein
MSQAGGMAEDFGKGILKGGLNTVNGVSNLIHKIPGGVGEALVPSSGLTAAKMYAQPANTTQSVGKGVEQAAEFLAPGLGEEGAAAKLAEFAPQLGRAAAPIARMGVQALGSGAINKAQGGSFATGAAAGGAGAGIGEGLRAAAPLLAESALGVRGNDKMYGRTVGNAILNDTKGVRPATIERSAQNTISTLKPQVEQIASNASAAGRTGSLAPARANVAAKIAEHRQNYSPISASELEPLQNQITIHPITGVPLAAQQSPTELLRMKRGVDNELIGNWNPLTGSRPALGQARQVYGNLADEFHNAAPGTKELDQRISSLIPVTRRADISARAPGVLESTMNRFRVPTGALAGAVGGGIAGGESRGLPGAVVGAGLGAIAPSLIGSPTTQMIMARGLNGAVPRLIPAAVGSGLQFDRRGNQ